MSALFTLIDDDAGGVVVEPTEYARGPWDPSSLHGGPVAALIARTAEHLPAPAQMMISRLTVEIERPVPLARLVVRSRAIREGRRVQLLEIELADAATDTLVTRSRVLRQRVADVAVPATERPAPPPPSDSVGPSVSAWNPELTAFHNRAVEHHFVEGDFDRTGPAVDWIRLDVDVLEGEPPTPTQRVAAAADFANGISRELDFDTHVFINPDLTIHLLRPPVGDWVCLDSRTYHGPSGTGMSTTRLFDLDGFVGMSQQSLFIDAR